MPDRHYNVKIKNLKGKTIVHFKGTVVRKEQKSGRIAGSVKETLHVKDDAIVEVK
jgi:hypothetical protein